MFRQKRHAAGPMAVAGDGEVAIHETYHSRLNMYTTKPDSEVTIDEFQQWAIDRMSVLDKVEDMLTTGDKHSENVLRAKLQELLPLTSGGSGGRKAADAERKKDHYSHYILRLAFCRDALQKTRFIRLETALFKFRFNSDDLADRRKFIAGLDLNIEPVDNKEWSKLEKKLSEAAGSNGVPEERYFKVKFTRVPDLIKLRRVYLSQGYAYVPETHILSLIQNKFETDLRKSLETLNRAIPRMDEGERLEPMLDHLSKGFSMGEETKMAGDSTITAESVAIWDKDRDLPLCISTMHRKLQTSHGARYTARTIMNRFLKHSDMSIEQAIRYWRKAYVTKTDRDFEKDYRYNIRHDYGLEGSKRQYGRPSCEDIVRKPPKDSEESNGCPFQYLTESALVERLKGLGVTQTADLASIQLFVNQRSYHKACGKVYELTHPDDKAVYDSAIHQPNEYLARALQHRKTANPITDW